MKLEQHHENKLLSAYRHEFTVAGAVASSGHSLDELCAAGFMEAKRHQPDKRSKPYTRYYLTEKGRAHIEPIAKRKAAQIAKQRAEMEAKERLEAAAPDMLAALEMIDACFSRLQATEEEVECFAALDAAIAKAKGSK